MKTLALGLTMALGLAIAVPAANAQLGFRAGAQIAPGAAVSFGTFYRTLSPYGFWTNLDPWGEVWVPTGMEQGWEPYTMGHWLDTNDGWTWISDYDWGWAPFHYGRWYLSASLGWVWVPGDIWAPAWVAWREGAGLAGWAPLPPEAGWQVGFGFTIGNIDAYIPQGAWLFVGDRDFGRDHLYPYIHRETRFERDYRDTRDVTRYGERDHHVWDRGIDRSRIERATGRALPRYRVITRGEPGRAREMERDHSVRIYRPHLNGNGGGRLFAEPPRARGERGNRGDMQGILPGARNFEALRRRELDQLFGFSPQGDNHRGDEGRRGREYGRHQDRQRPRAAVNPFGLGSSNGFSPQGREGRQQHRAFQRSPRQRQQFEPFGRMKEQQQRRQFEQMMQAQHRRSLQRMRAVRSGVERGPANRGGRDRAFQGEHSHEGAGGHRHGDDHGGGRR